MRASHTLRSLVLTVTVAIAALTEGPAAASAVGPGLLTRPAAAGRPFTGEVVTLTAARWRVAADVVERRWIRCVRSPVTGGCRPQDIAGETAATYVITAADIGATVYAAERAHDATGWSGWFTSNAPGDDEMPQGASPYVTPGPAPPQLVPRWTTLPSVNGTWRVGSTLTATPGTWTPPADRLEYRWERCQGGEDGEQCEVSGIPGATSRTYVLGAPDAGAWPQVAVRAHNANGWSPWAESLLERWDPVGERLAGGPPAGSDHGSGDGGGPDAPGTVAIRRLTLNPTRFRAASRGATFGAGRGGTRVMVRVGARPAALRFRVERRSGSRWMMRGRTLHVTPSASVKTTVSLRFSGRLSGRRLPAGSYRLLVVAVDRAGGTSAVRTARFTIVR